MTMRFLKNIFSKMEKPTQPISSKDFKLAIKEYFAPQLRTQGWKGSGFDFYKDDSPILFVMSFIPNKYGGSFYIEVGIHYSFITDISGELFDKKNLKTYKLDFRRRLKDKQGKVEWKYPSDVESCSQLLDHIWTTFHTNGQAFFNQFDQYGEPWLSINPSDLNSKEKYSKYVEFELPADARSAWMISQILGFYEKRVKAVQMAKYGLSKINPPQGQSLIPPLNKIIEKYT